MSVFWLDGYSTVEGAKRSVASFPLWRNFRFGILNPVWHEWFIVWHNMTFEIWQPCGRQQRLSKIAADK